MGVGIFLTFVVVIRGNRFIHNTEFEKFRTSSSKSVQNFIRTVIGGTTG
jgi:hypothetical protein